MCRINFRRFCEEWRIWIRPLLIVTYAIFAIIVVPLLIVNSVKDGFSRKDQLILIGGLFVLSAVPVSTWHIIQHVIHFTKPILQKHIIRILWMVPIYALNAWIGLFFPRHSIYVDSLRECYEAYVIYNFMVYLLHYLNLSMDLEATMEYRPQVYHFFPMCCMRPWPMGREFIHNCKHGILQYTVVRPITTFIAVICELCGVYGEGTFAGNVAFPYIVVINNISQFAAMYCLVLFYRANKEDLKPMKPIPKFLCIKAVVFFSFFQGVLLNILVYYGIINHIFGASDDALGGNTNLASMLQNFLICIEMFLAAVAHIYSFPHHPFHINSPQYWNNTQNNWCRAFLSMIDISDMQEDVTEHLGVVSSSISRRFQGRSSYQPLARGPRRSSLGGSGGGGGESEYLIGGKRLSEADNDDLLETGNNDQWRDDVTVKRNTHGYGATSRLVVNVSIAPIMNDIPSSSQLATVAGAAGVPNVPQLSAIPQVSSTPSHFGINIQQQRRDTLMGMPRDYFGAAPPPGGASGFLHTRNNANSNLTDSNDEFASFMGIGGGATGGIGGAR